MPKRRLGGLNRRLFVIAGLASVYFITGKIGLRFAAINPSATAIWAPAGITVASFLLLGYRVWPAIILGAFLVNVTTAGAALTSLAIAVGNTLEGMAGAYLVNRFANGRRVFDRVNDALRFLILAALGRHTRDSPPWVVENLIPPFDSLFAAACY